MSKIENAIKAEILKIKTSRNRLSKDAGLSPGQLSRVMSGERGLGIDSAERLAEALGMEIIIRMKPVKRTKRAAGRTTKKGK